MAKLDGENRDAMKMENGGWRMENELKFKI
jgi:hypothetical protein